MINEKDLSREEKMFFDIQCKQLKKIFNMKRINFYSCHYREEAQKKILEIVKTNIKKEAYETIAFSDSVTFRTHDIGSK